MKKQITILLLFLFPSSFAWSQDKYIKTTTPCNDELLLKTPGAWLAASKRFSAKTTQQELQQTENRLNTIRQLTQNIYPKPMAFDAVVTYYAFDANFASQIKIQEIQGGLRNSFRNSFINGIPTILYEYYVKFCAYGCHARTPNLIVKNPRCEAGPVINVSINSLENFFWEFRLDDHHVDIFMIEGRPIRMMPVLTGKWKGYDLYSPEAGSGDKMVLLHRPGMLPYIPVTRKQYLERSIEYFERFFANTLKASENPEGLNLLMEKKERDEQTKKLQKYRDDILKYYQDELDATTRAGLLETPAITDEGIADMDISNPIFTTQENGGILLVTENPAYMKKDLPKYIPQLIVYMWNGDIGPDPTKNPCYVYYRDFPILSLQAMIDK
ncbi:MAG TPA: hypothetical protein VFP97_12075 [Chitinophagaceae bacterium]|nr:hypothetical protein [Chitinophagaceae bacterium]